MKWLPLLGICATLFTACAASFHQSSQMTMVLTVPLSDADAVPSFVNEEVSLLPSSQAGALLCEEEISDGQHIVCYWEPESEFTKFWAIRREGEDLRFFREESCYTEGYRAQSFSDILGQEGFSLTAPRGAAYTARDYYVLEEDGSPCLLAACAGEPLETDADGDGEKELLWFYHGGREVYYVFRQEDTIYEADLAAMFSLHYPDWVLLNCAPEAYEDGALPVTAVKGGWDYADDSNAHVSGYLTFTEEAAQLHLNIEP